jgi:hypothetical protein
MAPRCSGKKIGLFDESFDTHLSQDGASNEKTHGSQREQCMFDDEPTLASSYDLEFFSTVNMYYCNGHVNFLKFLVFI